MSAAGATTKIGNTVSSDTAVDASGSTSTAGQHIPITVRLKQVLREYQALIRELCAALANSAGMSAESRGMNLGKKPRVPAEAMRALIAKDDELMKACEELEGHLIFERKCAELRRQIALEDRAAKVLMSALEKAEDELTQAIDKAEPLVRSLAPVSRQQCH